MNLKLPAMVEFDSYREEYDFRYKINQWLGVELLSVYIGVLKHRQKFIFVFYDKNESGMVLPQEKIDEALGFYGVEPRHIVDLLGIA